MDAGLLSALYDHGPTLGALFAAVLWIARRLNQHEELCHRRELYSRESFATLRNETKNIKEDVEELKRERK